MKTLLTSLQADAGKAVAFFTHKEQVDPLPHLHSFPMGSCELVTAFLAVALAAKYADAPVEVAMAYDRPRNDWHFWLEVNGVVVDATAHQFSEYQHPLVCLRPSQLEHRFFDIERIPPDAALQRLISIPQAHKQWAVAALAREITS